MLYMPVACWLIVLKSILFTKFLLFCGFHVKTDLDDGGKVLSVDVVLRLEVQITQLAGSHRVVLGIELVEALEGLSALLKKQHKTSDKNFRRGRVG